MSVFNRYIPIQKMIVFVVVGFLLIIGNASASSIDSIQFLKISAQDGRAIIKTHDGKMRIIKAGDVIGDGSKVIEIAVGRVVLEEKADSGAETVIIRLEGGKQRVERVKKAPEKQPQLHAPHVQQEQKNKAFN